MATTKVRIKFDKLKGETAKAVLLQFGNAEHWLPKKLCWQFITNKKLGGNCIIPTWLYEQTFGEPPIDEQAAETVEHHIPTPIQPIAIQPDAALTR
jgi:hypothetical protein